MYPVSVLLFPSPTATDAGVVAKYKEYIEDCVAGVQNATEAALEKYKMRFPNATVGDKNFIVWADQYDLGYTSSRLACRNAGDAYVQATREAKVSDESTSKAFQYTYEGGYAEGCVGLGHPRSSLFRDLYPALLLRAQAEIARGASGSSERGQGDAAPVGRRTRRGSAPRATSRAAEHRCQWNPFHVSEDLVTIFLALTLFSRHVFIKTMGGVACCDRLLLFLICRCVHLLPLLILLCLC
ncbi:hypothetical protein FB451DRAFT_1386059 [Mycena latifolia]|nr:hypothetical protein FB451DRAFT_1386059 [Mycena latifolia]